MLPTRNCSSYICKFYISSFVENSQSLSPQMLSLLHSHYLLFWNSHYLYVKTFHAFLQISLTSLNFFIPCTTFWIISSPPFSNVQLFFQLYLNNYFTHPLSSYVHNTLVISKNSLLFLLNGFLFLTHVCDSTCLFL